MLRSQLKEEKQMKNLDFIYDYKDIAKYRLSFNKLANETF
jgi:hypothetical protein